MSEILLWDRNPYLTHAILPRSRESFTLGALVGRQIFSKMIGNVSDGSLMQVAFL